MQNDEQAIRDLVDHWLSASKEGDLDKVLALMADDVVFMVPGRDPFGKQEFAAMNKEMKALKIEGKPDIQEIKVLGDWAWMRNHLTVTFTPPDGSVMVHSGYVLSILNKQPAGNWVIARDANLLMPKG
jgi:uncharacterized protein (TIGR02246 family)